MLGLEKATVRISGIGLKLNEVMQIFKCPSTQQAKLVESEADVAETPWMPWMGSLSPG